MERSRCLGMCLLGVALSCCDATSSRSPDGAGATDDDAIADGLQGVAEIPRTPTGGVDTSGGPWRLIEVPAASNEPTIIRAADGWFALSRRSLGDARSPSGWQSALYHSTDGVRWEALPLEPGHDDLQLQGLAHGNGRFVITGRRGGEGVFWSSDDALEWTEVAQDVDVARIVGNVQFAGGLFFAFTFSEVAVSADGIAWTRVPISTVQPTAVAHGDGRFLLVGSGPMQVSTDGLDWQAHDVDCALPGACITDPSGVVHQSIQYHALFAEGRFFTDQLSSVDAVTWEGQPERAPAAYIDGLFIEAGGYELRAWTTGGELQALSAIRPVKASVTADGRAITRTGVLDPEADMPERVDVEFEDGLTCESASCLVVDNRLYLIPPPGTAPLPDRVPRDADGEPLLSDTCPYSSMLACDDYEARSGCRCTPSAPQAPGSCDDVSQFQCEGVFTPRDEEWQVAELDRGGCDCDAIDSNQPPGFGLPCEGDPTICEAPLSCLGIDSIFSGGPPPPQRMICTAACDLDADCPSWEATGLCAGPVSLRCSRGSCQPRACE